MKKFIFIAVLIFLVSVGIGYYFICTLGETTTNNEKISKIREENNYIYSNTSVKQEVKNTIRTNTSEEKISPNAVLILKKKFKSCNHEIKSSSKIPEELVNLSKEEVAGKYSGWELIGFSSKEVVFYKECEGICNEHYVLREDSKNVVIYKVDENKNEELYRDTDIAVKYLTDEDKEKLKEGIYVYSKEELNSALEDFE